MINKITPNGKLGIQPPPQPDSIDRFKRLVNSEPALTCPFLGLKEDSETLTNYASEDNHCHCKGRARPIPLDHQQMHCLFEYTTCQVFLKRMAAEVRAREKVETQHQPVARRSPLGMMGALTNMLGIK